MKQPATAAKGLALIVQVIGPPGSGKSTLIRQLAHARQVAVIDLARCRTIDGVRVKGVRRKVAWLTAAATNPTLALRLLPKVDRTHVVFRLALEALRRDRQMRALAQRDGLSIVDEGPIHPLLWSLAISGWMGDTSKFAPLLLPPDLVVTVTVPTSLAADRLLAAGRRSVANRERKLAEQAIERYSALGEDLLAAMDVAVVAAQDGIEHLATAMGIDPQ